jgi:hypothetical protein
LGKEEANMAKRVMDRRALRAQADAAERLESETEGQGTETSPVGDEVNKPEKAAKAKEKGPPKPRKTKPRVPKAPLRMRFVWTVFTNSYQPVAKFDYANKAEADAQAAKLTAEKRVAHFVIAVKEPIETEVGP